MSRVQVLDVGDRVAIADHKADRDGVVAFIDPTQDRINVVWDSIPGKPAYYQEGWTRRQLTRIGGDLQPGDFVRVTGEGQRLASDDVVTFDEAEGIVVDETEYGFLLVWVWGSAREYQVRPQSLTRITRAEALA